jgi:hypothetical protein
VVKKLLAKFDMLLCREKDLLSRPLPERGKEEDTDASSREMEEALSELRALGKEYFEELTRLAADKAKERELWRELAFLQELHRKRKENIFLGGKRLGLIGKELDRLQAEKKAYSAYSPGLGRKEAGFVDSKF